MPDYEVTVPGEASKVASVVGRPATDVFRWGLVFESDSEAVILGAVLGLALALVLFA